MTVPGKKHRGGGSQKAMQREVRELEVTEAESEAEASRGQGTECKLRGPRGNEEEGGKGNWRDQKRGRSREGRPQAALTCQRKQQQPGVVAVRRRGLGRIAQQQGQLAQLEPNASAPCF